MFRTYIYRNNRNKQNCFVTNGNNPTFSEKYPNILSFKLFGWDICLFRFNRNIETLCFGIEAKQPKQTVSKQAVTNRKKRKKRKKNDKNRKNLIFSVKIAKYAPYHCFGWSFACFGSIENMETLCFGIEVKQPKQTFCFG